MTAPNSNVIGPDCIADLCAEVKRLRAQVADLEKQRERLQAQVADLEKQREECWECSRQRLGLR